jgi:CheY-like chemotaxis protein
VEKKFDYAKNFCFFYSSQGIMEKLAVKKSFDLSGISILIAEDDPISMLIVSKMLDIKNASVLEAENGAEAIELLDESPVVDVVLLDLEMPTMNGYVAVKKIKEKFPAIPVLAITANLIDKNMQSSLSRDGFSDTITKPFKPDVFYNKILHALNKDINMA